MKARVVLGALAGAVSFALAAAGCSDDKPRSEGWTVRQAEAITTIRGMAVRVIRCRGFGKQRGDERPARYGRFACEAGTRRQGDTYDTVGIQYEVRVRGTSRFVLENVVFYGGPGIP